MIEPKLSERVLRVFQQPNIGDEWSPVFMTGGGGIDSYGAEYVHAYSESPHGFLILCHRGRDDATWKVVAVLDESTTAHIARYIIGQVL